MGKRKILAGLTALVLCLGILCPVPVRAADVFFTAINDRVLELTNESMPVWSGGVLYAPYTTFDAATNGTRWGIESSYNKANSYLSLYDLEQRKFLEFDIQEGTCKDGLTNETFSARAILRGGRPYLPVKTVCAFFGLEYSCREITQGSLLRIKTDEVVISDRDFADAAENILNLRLRDYNQSQNSGQTTTTPTVPQPPVQEEEPVDERNVATYLSFRCEDGDYLEALLMVLKTQKAQAVFFLSPELMNQRSDLIMWMLGEGHSVALLAQGSDLEETSRLLEQGSRALEEQAFLRTAVVLAPSEYQKTLEDGGWICWNSTLELSPGDATGANYFARRTLNQLNGRKRATYLTLDVSENTLRVLPTLIRQLKEEGYHLALPLETRL